MLYRCVENIEISIRYRYIVSYRIAGRNIEIFDISRYQISIYHVAEFSFIYLFSPRFDSISPRVRIVNEKEPERRAPKARECSAPSAPSIEAPSAPRIEAPSAPRIEAPSAPRIEAPRGVGCGEGCPTPHRGRGLGKGAVPPPHNFF